MFCKKCKREIPEASAYCNLCGAKQIREAARRTRANGQGTVYRLPNGKWRAEVVLGYTPDMRKIRRTRSDFVKKSDAFAYLPILKQIAPAADRKITFLALYTEWEARYEERITKSTLNCYRAALRRYTPIHYAVFTDLNTAHLQKCLDNGNEVKETGAKGVTKTVKLPVPGRRTRENMKALGTLLYAYANERDITEKNYAKFLYVGKDDAEESEPFTKEETENIRNAVGTVPYADYILCLIYTGFRPGEMLELQKNAYNSAENYLVGGGKTEAGEDRTVTVSPKIELIIKRLAANANPYLFPREGGKRLMYNYFNKNCYYQALQAIGVRGLKPYACRHTFATLMKDVDAPETDKAKLMGHTSYEMTKHYTHTDIQSLRNITDRI